MVHRGGEQCTHDLLGIELVDRQRPRRLLLARVDPFIAEMVEHACRLFDRLETPQALFVRQEPTALYPSHKLPEPTCHYHEKSGNQILPLVPQH